MEYPLSRREFVAGALIVGFTAMPLVRGVSRSPRARPQNRLVALPITPTWIRG
jgi:hypothetical protein